MANEREGRKFDGVKAVAEMLNVSDKAMRERLMAELEARDPAMAEKVRAQVFTFEDLRKMDPRALQKLLREFPLPKLALALRNMDEDFRAFICTQLSEKAGKILRDEIEAIGPRPLSEVTRAQQEILQRAKLD
ncbi:MAG: FliG C-terminal domain-containing protein [Bdellovibrionota bacterium]